MALQRTSFLTAPAAANDMLQASEGQCLLVVMEETSLKWIPEWMQLMLITKCARAAAHSSSSLQQAHCCKNSADDTRCSRQSHMTHLTVFLPQRIP